MENSASVIELIIKLRDAMSGPAQKAEQKLSKFGVALQKFEKRARSMKSLFYAGAAMEGMAWGLGESLKHLADPAIKFQIAQQDLERATHLSTAQLEAFQHQATQLSDRWPRSASEITESQANLVRTLGSAKAAMETVGIATEFATGTQTDLKSATNLLATAYENVGDKSVPLKVGFQRIADQLTVLQNKFSTSRENGDMLVRSFARLSGVAKVAGINTTQLMAAMGVLNKSGFAGGRGAGEYLSQALERLGELGKNGIPTIEKYGIMLAGSVGAHGTFHLNLLQTLKNMQQASPMRLQAYLKSLGQVGGTLKILMDRYGQVNAAVKTFEHTQGATYSLASEMNKGWHQQLEDLHNVWGNLDRSLGQVLVPLLIEVAHVLEPILERFRKFAEAHATLVKVGFAAAIVFTGLLALGGAIAITAAAFGTLSATLGIASAAFADATAASWAFVASLLADPVFDVIAGFVALTIGAYELIHHWKAVEGFFERLWPIMARPFVEAWRRVEEFGRRIEGWGLKVLNWFEHHKIFAALTGPIGWMILAADELITHWKTVESFFVHLGDVVGGVFKDVEKFLHIGHAASAPAAHVKHHQVVEHIAHVARSATPVMAAFGGAVSSAVIKRHHVVEHVARVMRSAPGAMAAFAGPAPVLAAAGGGVNGGVHFHVHMEGGAPGADAEAGDGLADQILDALHRNQGEFADVFSEINDRARGRWAEAGF